MSIVQNDALHGFLTVLPATQDAEALIAAVVSLFHHLANIFQEQNQPPPSGGIRVAVDRKLLRKIKAKKIAQGHKADDHEPEMQL